MIGLSLFLVGIVGALLTATTALVVWLAGWIGVIYAALAVCLLFVAIAIGSYLLVLRRPMQRIRRQLETVSYVADLIEQGYDWVLQQCSLALGVFQRLIEQISTKTKEPAE